MRSRWMFTLTAALVWASACQPPAAAPDTAAALDALREADRQYSETGGAKNRDAFLAFYAADAAVYPPGSDMLSGPEGMGTMYDQILADPAFALSFGTPTVEVSADGAMGYTVNTGQLTLTGPDGSAMTESFRDLHVWERQADGSWKLIVDMWNHGAPPEGAAAN